MSSVGKSAVTAIDYSWVTLTSLQYLLHFLEKGEVTMC